jgi:AcrR family transcriptional regulator
MSQSVDEGAEGRITPVAAVVATRGRVTAAAFELFSTQGYDGTTVEAIAERAGIARRTFFRYFRSKDDVIFPDHDRMLATVEQHLAACDDLSPVDAICDGVRLVLRCYVEDPQISVRRYLLTRSIGPLRDREIASVQRYERSFGRYLRARWAGSRPAAEVALHADVISAAVVAAHNAVLREWLRAEGGHDPMPALDEAFTWVVSQFETTTPQEALPRADAQWGPGAAPLDLTVADRGGDVVVAVFRADRPLGDVVERISRSL